MTTKMRPIRETITLDAARALIGKNTPLIMRVELVTLQEANGRVIARDVVSDVDVPPFSRAAMDGYAVRTEDTAGASRQNPKTLKVVDRVFTGQMPGRAIAPGECAEIATGAPMPEGANAVVMVEETDGVSPGRAEGQVQIFAAVRPGQNVGRKGADIQSGQTVVRNGDVLNPSRIGALAAIGTEEVNVYGRPRVAILSTGDEIVEPGQPLEPGQLYDINRFTLTAIVENHGGVPEPHRTAADTLDDLSDAIEDCLDADVLVFSGGSSVGARDLVLDILAQKGEILFHGISVKPGKPTAFGLVKGKPFFGMPGYPTSCLSNGYMLLVPALRQMARLPPHRTRSILAPLGQRIVSTTDRHQFYTVRLIDGVVLPAFKASGDITSMSQADGYIEIPAGTDVVEKDEVVEVKLF